MLTQRQSGFTLVELMVAMAVGTIIILGAGQLFLTTFQTFQKVDDLSRKQEIVVFAANRLTNEYRKGSAVYGYEPTKDSNGNELDECSIMETSQPLVGGLALYEEQCDEDRFVNDEIEYDGMKLDGYYRFTLDFERDDESLETLSFHVMERPQPGSCLPQEAEDGDAFIAGSRVPSPAGFIDSMRSRSEVTQTCDGNVMRTSSDKFFYCGGSDGNINNLDVAGLDGKVIMAEQGINFQINDNQSTLDVALVAKNAINMGGSNNQDAQLSGVFWSAQNIGLGANGVNFLGSVLSTNNFTMSDFSSETESREPWCLLDPYYSISENIGE